MNALSVSLRLLSGSASPARSGTELPARLKLLNWGANATIVGEVLLDDQSAAAFAANQRAIGRERIALDFEHNTVEGTAEYQHSQEPRRIAAQGRPEVVPGDGLYLADLTWTETGTAHARDYEDLSPALFLQDGRVIGIHSAALTRTGAVHGLTAFSAGAGLGALLQTLSAGSAGHTKNQVNDTTMPDEKPAPAPELAALTARLDTIESALNQIREADTPGKVVALSATVATLETRLQQSATAADEAERESLVAQAARDGKIIPLSADAVKTVPLPLLKDIIANMPKNVVPLHANAKPGETKPELKGFAAVQAAIAEHLKHAAK